MSIVTRILAFAAFLTFFVSGTALADKRVALLIGNSSYEAVAQLTNPARDVAAMKAALEGAGFEKVDVGLDLGHDKLIRALRDFEDDAQHADIALIYYSGHGMEMNGQNYLLPVDAHLASDRDVEDEAVALDRVLRSLENVKRLRLVILDACRNNPFATKMVRSKGTRAVDRGLARVEPTNTDTLIAFAAKAGTVASDGDEGNSPFTASLVKRLVEPGTDIRIALGNVRDDVLAATKNEQEPITYGSLGGGKIVLAMDTTSVPLVVPDQGAKASDLKLPGFGQPQFNPCGDAAAHWAEAQKFDRLEFYQRHLALFGQCAFADFARLRIEEKTKQASLPPTVKTDDQAPAVGATLCDQLAADPIDPKKVGLGVPWDKLDGPKAVSACRSALQADPRNGRFAFQLGRALEKTQEYLSAAAAYRQGGENGYAKAFLALAYLYEDGNGVARDDAKAVELLQQAAERGSIDALTELGFLVSNGRGAARDDAAAARYYQQAADKGSPLAMNNLGYMYETGRGVPMSIEQAVRLYRQSADAGNALAASNLGALYRDGRGVPRDMGEAVRYFKKAVDEGEHTGMYKLGLLYRDGNGVLQDSTEAVRLFQLAANRGNVDATTELGYDYENGIGGLKRDSQEAARLYKKAADMGSALAMNNLGYLTQVGKGVAKNPEEAVRLYKKAVDAGNGLAATNLGYLYEMGIGVPKNVLEAARYYQIGSDRGDGMASGNLGGLYRDGNGVRKDLKEAARLFRKGIEQGDHFSMLKLGFLYKEGQGVPRSDTEALRLFNQAAQKNNTDAMYQLGLFATLGRGGPKDAATAANWLVKAIAGGNSFSLTEMTTNSGAWGAPFRAAVQVELKQRGLYNGPVNGTFGASTIAALKQLAGG